jgi:hypothetical protein
VIEIHADNVDGRTFDGGVVERLGQWLENVVMA